MRCALPRIKRAGRERCSAAVPVGKPKPAPDRFATKACATSLDIIATQQLLGHSKPETTMRYVQLPDDALRELTRPLRPLRELSTFARNTLEG